MQNNARHGVKLAGGCMFIKITKTEYHNHFSEDTYDCPEKIEDPLLREVIVGLISLYKNSETVKVIENWQGNTYPAIFIKLGS
jgi:hypothetical protein